MKGSSAIGNRNWLLIAIVSFLTGGTITAIWMRGVNISLLSNIFKPYLTSFAGSAKIQNILPKLEENHL